LNSIHTRSWLCTAVLFVAFVFALTFGAPRSARPVGASLLASARMITRGVNHTCAISTAGAAYCWGRNDFGQLGNGNTTNSNVPVQVLGLTSNVIAISGGNGHTCAIVSGSLAAARCWGRNEFGGLGNGSQTNSSVPVPVSNSANFVGIAAGGSHSCAWTSSGAAFCWGFGGNGELGNGGSAFSMVPSPVSGLSSGVAELSAGYSHTCARLTNGSVKCWGFGGEGRLGNNSDVPSAVPVDVLGLSSGVVSHSAGRMHNCVVMNTGEARCWGYNAFGQLGAGNNNNQFAPTTVSALGAAVQSVAAGFSHTCFGLNSGTVHCAGSNEYGQLGANGGSSNIPNIASNVGGPISMLVADDRHTCLMTPAGVIRCWGHNHLGQLGNNTNTNSVVPVEVIGFGGLPTAATFTPDTPLTPQVGTITATFTPTPTRTPTITPTPTRTPIPREPPIPIVPTNGVRLAMIMNERSFEEREPNDTRNQASGPLTNGKYHLGYASNGATSGGAYKDYFWFDVKQPGRIVVEVSNYYSRGQVQLFSTLQEMPVAASTTIINNRLALLYNAPNPGVYYVYLNHNINGISTEPYALYVEFP
jgi:alpha-tubulin suppressor-like RCC1 family protein